MSLFWSRRSSSSRPDILLLDTTSLLVWLSEISTHAYDVIVLDIDADDRSGTVDSRKVLQALQELKRAFTLVCTARKATQCSAEAVWACFALLLPVCKGVGGVATHTRVEHSHPCIALNNVAIAASSPP